MKIAQVSPLYESVPPALYGGTERIVSFLTEELVAQGHDVTLFASGDSVTSARLIAPCEASLRLSEQIQDHCAIHMLMLEQVIQRADQFDMIHFHTDYLHYSAARRLRTPHVTTLHGRLDLPELKPLYREFSDIPLVSISDAQRKPLPRARWEGTVHHGLPREPFTFRGEPGDYLVFVGRYSKEKRADRAIEIAKAAGMKLKLAAKVDPADVEYFRERIEPLLDHPLIENVGEVDEAGKIRIIGGAAAFLFPIDWPEPFGLVMIESMACGTPVIAFNHGSVPEVMVDGVSGLVVETVEEAIAAVPRALALDRRRIRAVFEERFTAGRMARDYVDLYERLIAENRFIPLQRERA